MDNNVVFIQRNPGCMSYDVWFVIQAGRQRMVGRFVPQEGGPARFEWQEEAEGEHTEPTLRMDGAMLAALANAIDENGPTTQDGLTLARDVIKVRDRLLTLVENLVINTKDSEPPHDQRS